MSIESIKSNVSFPELKGKGELDQGKLTRIYESLFDLKVDFTMSAKIKSVLVINGTGRITISGKQLNLSIDYGQQKPTSEGKFVTEVTSVKFDGGFLTNFMIDIAKTLLIPNIAAKIKEIEDEHHGSDPLSTLETPKILDKETSISFTRTASTVSIGEDELFRTVDTIIIHGSERKKLDKECSISGPFTITSFCYCPYMFLEVPAIVGAEGNVSIEDWKLKGKVIELYEVLPDLINYYSPDADYTVTRKDIESPQSNFAAKYELAKRYIFKIENNVVLNITTRFGINMTAEVKGKKLFVKYNNIAIANIMTKEVIHPPGRTVLLRLMLAEASKMGGNLFTDGIPIEARDQTNNTNFCFDLPTNP